MQKTITLLYFLLSFCSAAFAQREHTNWYFGNNAGITFTPGGPQALTNSAMVTYEACASVSDAAGNLLFYTNSVNIWNRTHQLMPNGQAIGGHESASQGSIIVRNPGNAAQYYVFVVDACDNNMVGGLKYALVDMSLQNGNGAVVNNRVQVSTVSLTEKLTTVPHANGRDTWVIVHGWRTNQFLSFLVTPAGVSTTPVVSTIGSVHSGGGGALGNANGVGYMKVSPDGRKLALGIRDSRFELFDFSTTTGAVSNYIALSQFYRSYGVEFSPDGSRLYGTNLDGYEIYQFNLLAGSAGAIAASGIRVGYSPLGYTGALQLGPDGKIYVAQFGGAFLGVINAPNALGVACGFQSNGVSLGGRICQIGLPNHTYQTPAAPVPSVTITAPGVCMGSSTAFVATLTNAPANATLTWNFGEPVSGPANTGTGFTASHLYSAAGAYPVVATLTAPGLAAPVVTSFTAIVYAMPQVNLGAALQRVCAGQSLVLSAGTQVAGSTYRWQDGSTAPTYNVTVAGTYSVTVISPQGCSAQATTQVQLINLPQVSLGRDTVACLAKSPVVLRVANPATGATYRWQDGSSNATYTARVEGLYSVEVTSAAGCSRRAEVRVSNGGCPPPVIPNIITPNGDKDNETFLLKELNVSDWNIEIYNRWGRQVYKKASYDNSWNAAGQPDGVYYYLLRNVTTGQQYKGWVDVNR